MLGRSLACDFKAKLCPEQLWNWQKCTNKINQLYSFYILSHLVPSGIRIPPAWATFWGWKQLHRSLKVTHGFALTIGPWYTFVRCLALLLTSYHTLLSSTSPHITNEWQERRSIVVGMKTRNHLPGEKRTLISFIPNSQQIKVRMHKQAHILSCH